MAFQTGSNYLVAIKREVAATPGVAATEFGACVLRTVDSPGLKLNRANIQSAERNDAMIRPMPRLGFKTVDGSLNSEWSVGGAIDMLLAALLRTVWSTDITKTYDNTAAHLSLEVTDASTLTQVGTDSFVDVFYVGDVIVLSNMTSEANNGIQLLITAVAANVLTIAGTPLTVEGADIACTITRLNKVLTYAGAGTPTHESLEITATNTIVSVGTTSFVGVIYVGDIIRLAGMSNVLNNDINLRVATVAANTLTVVGTPLTIQVA
ncbi:MAG TPA: phage tail tube protein, partial [Phycisphaerae bacterium]|nr:phage tail tube protein [Phycisphaerae bacterium]